VAVASGKAALDVLAKDSRFDLVITDIVMPEMTGVELAREVAHHYGGLRILFVTGYVGEAGTFEELDGADLLRKPFTVAQLSAAVDRALPRDSALEAAAE
jgi:CheY-like chemotaxis protein